MTKNVSVLSISRSLRIFSVLRMRMKLSAMQIHSGPYIKPQTCNYPFTCPVDVIQHALSS